MNESSRAFRYLAASGGNGARESGALARIWGLLSRPRKRYAAYLVKKYAYPAKLAIQRAYIHGFDRWPYDYRNGHIVMEEAEPSSFGFM